MGITEVDLQLELTEIDRNRVNTINTAGIDHLALREGNNISSDLLISHMEGNMLLINKDPSTVKGHLNLTDLKVLEVSILVYLSKASLTVIGHNSSTDLKALEINTIYLSKVNSQIDLQIKISIDRDLRIYQIKLST